MSSGISQVSLGLRKRKDAVKREAGVNIHDWCIAEKQS